MEIARIAQNQQKIMDEIAPELRPWTTPLLQHLDADASGSGALSCSVENSIYHPSS